MPVENHPNDAQAPASAWIERRGVAEALAAAVAFLIFFATIFYRFVYDDLPQIVNNPALRSWSYLPQYFTSHVWKGYSATSVGNYYRPLFLVWMRLNHMIFGLSAWGWHLTTILCHVTVAVLVVRVARRLTGNTKISLLAGLLFAVHPVHIESVAWVSGVTDPLLAIFFLAAFLVYLQWCEKGGWWRYLSLLLLTAGALLSKETAVVLPLVIFVYVLLRKDGNGWLLRAKNGLLHILPLVLLIGVYSVARVHALGQFAFTETPLDPLTRLLTPFELLSFYLRHLLVPVNLTVFYDLPFVSSLTAPVFAISLAWLLLFAVVGWFILRWMEDTRLGIFLLSLILLPLLPVFSVTSLGTGDMAHDRYLYISSVGMVILLAMAAVQARNVWPQWRNKIILAVFAVTGLYGAVNLQQQTYWHDDLSLDAHGYLLSPKSNLACVDLGGELITMKDYAHADALFHDVLQRDPKYWLAIYNLGYSEYLQRRFAEARQHFLQAIAINPTDPDEYLYYGISLMKEGDVSGALPWVQTAVKIKPAGQGYHYVLGAIWQKLGNNSSARSEFMQELANYPNTAAVEQQLKALPPAAQ